MHRKPRRSSFMPAFRGLGVLRIAVVGLIIGALTAASVLASGAGVHLRSGSALANDAQRRAALLADRSDAAASRNLRRAELSPAAQLPSSASAAPDAASRGAVVRPRILRAPVAPPLGRGVSWAPPALSSPVVMQLGDTAAPITLAAGQDYVLRLPAGRAAVMQQGLSITGGRNVVVVGGAVDVAGGYVSSLGQTRRAMYLKGQTGTVYIEGVSFGSSTVGTLTEGIDLDQRYGAVVVLQNIKIGRLTGSYSTNHADGLQTWAGPRKLLIDGLSIDTGYQGMFLLPNQHFAGPVPELFDFRNVSIFGEASSAYMMWKDSTVFPFHLSNVYVTPGTHALTDRSQFLMDPTQSLGAVIARSTVPSVASRAGVAYR